MASRVEIPEADRPTGFAEYRWRSIADWNSVSARFEGEPLLPEAGSLEQFIAEHYWAYTSQRDGGTMEYRVEHPPWRVWPAAESFLECDAGRFYGPEFREVLSSKPSSAFVAEGSEVTVSSGHSITV